MAQENEGQVGILLLRFVFYFTLLFSIVELFAGLGSHSLLLIEESVHMFADSISFGVNLWAELKSQEKGSKQFAQLIGTFVSFITLSGTLFAVFWESVNRLSRESLVRVDARVMLGFGIALSSFHAACLLAYYCGVNILHSHSHGDDHSHEHNHSHSHGGKKHIKLEKIEFDASDVETDSTCTDEDHHDDELHNPNLVSAMFHVLVDFLHSFLVIVTAAVVLYSDGTNSGKIDAVSSLLLCIIIFSGCVVLFKSLYRQAFSYKAMHYDKLEESPEETKLARDAHSDPHCHGHSHSKLEVA